MLSAGPPAPPCPLQLGPDDVPNSVMSDLLVQMASKPAFHELRTRQRLGYSVHLSSSSLHRQLGLVVRVQSPSTPPDAISAAVRGWMAGFRGELGQLLTDKLDSYKQVWGLGVSGCVGGRPRGGRGGGSEGCRCLCAQPRQAVLDPTCQHHVNSHVCRHCAEGFLGQQHLKYWYACPSVVVCTAPHGTPSINDRILSY